MNIAIVSVTLLALSAFVAFGLASALRAAGNFSPFFPATDGPALHGFFYATALNDPTVKTGPRHKARPLFCTLQWQLADIVSTTVGVLSIAPLNPA